MSKVIRHCVGFASLRSVIGFRNSQRYKTKTNHNLDTCVFLRFLPEPRFALSSHWLLVIFPFVLIGRCDCFGFGFTTLIQKALYNLLFFNSVSSLSHIFSFHQIICFCFFFFCFVFLFDLQDYVTNLDYFH